MGDSVARDVAYDADSSTDGSVIVLTRAWSRAIRYLQQLPGPAWSMALWLAVSMLSRLLQGLSDRVPVTDWIPQLAFQSAFLAAILVWPRTRRNWLPLFLLASQVLIAYSLMLTNTTPAGQLSNAIALIIAVIYAGIWWHGWLPYAVATAGSLMYLHAAARLGTVEELDNVWLALTIGLFGVAFGINVLSVRTAAQITRDVLTGALNRAALNQYVDIEGRGGRSTNPRALISIDLDGFKKVNDTHGHAAGDAVLVDCVRAWQDNLRGDDLLFRVGGDEFLVVAPKCSPLMAARLIERLRDGSPFDFSAGTAEWPEGADFDAALLEADRRMYTDKGNGEA